MTDPIEIIRNIDAGLEAAGIDEKVMFVTDDRLRSLEDEVWQELDASVAGGWRTEQEAHEAFMQWRESYRSIGAPAVRASQTMGMHKQTAFDSKARMFRG